MKQVNATPNFLLCLELALMPSSFRLKAYKHCFLILADLWYIGIFLKKIQIHTSLFCVHVKEDYRMSDVGPLPQLPQRAAAGRRR